MGRKRGGGGEEKREVEEKGEDEGRKVGRLREME